MVGVLSLNMQASFKRDEARLLLWGIVSVRFINICVTATTNTP
jgi:hypothetical protein